MATTYKVRLISVLNNIATSDRSNQFTRQEVVFENTPTFSESGAVEYTPVQPVHMPGAVQVYKNTAPRQFSIGWKAISRTQNEATTNSINLQLLRSWRFPFFGKGSSTLPDQQRNNLNTKRELEQTPTLQSQQLGTEVPQSDSEAEEQAVIRARTNSIANNGFELLGAPPEVLYLYAYSSPDLSRADAAFINLNAIPVVLTNLEITYPDDVDYIPNAYNQPFPVRMDVTVSLAETHSPKEFQQFSLQKFKLGQLDYF